MYLHVCHTFYCRSEINYLMDLADTNRDGLLDYQEFTERFYQPTHTLGMNIYHIMACCIMTHLIKKALKSIVIRTSKL